MRFLDITQTPQKNFPLPNAFYSDICSIVIDLIDTNTTKGGDTADTNTNTLIPILPLWALLRNVIKFRLLKNYKSAFPQRIKHTKNAKI